MPRQREEIWNAKLGRLLIARHPSWNENNVHIDSTNTIRDHAGLKIDVLIENPGGQPVAIEAKFESGSAALRKQVEDRIGLTISNTGNVIEAGISVVYPEASTSVDLERQTLQYAVHQLVPVRKVGISGIGAGGKRPRSISQEAVRRTKNSSRPLRASTDRSLPRARGSVAAAGPPLASRRARSGAGCCNRSGAMADSGVRPAWDAGEPGASGCGRTPPIGRRP